MGSGCIVGKKSGPTLPVYLVSCLDFGVTDGALGHVVCATPIIRVARLDGSRNSRRSCLDEIESDSGCSPSLCHVL